MAEPSQSFIRLCDSGALRYPVSFFTFRLGDDPATGDTEERRYSRKGYAAKLVHAVLRASGFTECSGFSDANVIWGGPIEDAQYRRLQPHQRLTHYNKTFSLGSKSGYNCVMKRLAARLGACPAFYPASFQLPEERAELEAAFPSSPLWISKPGGGARGEGIQVIDRMPGPYCGHRIIQKYIQNPMLIDGLKFDLRFYVAVTSLDPLMVFVHQNGLVRLATEKYNENLDNISNTSAHLTNFSINRHNPLFKATDDMSQDGTGNKWTLNAFWPYLAKQGLDAEAIRRSIYDAIASVIIAARETFMQQSNHRLSFEMFGFDVMLDSDANPYVIEVNVTPALGTSSKLDAFVKSPVVRDLFNIGLIPKPSESVGKVHELITEYRHEVEAGIAVISEYEISLQRAGQFHCIFPVQGKKNLFDLLEMPRKSDEELQKWVSFNEEEKEAYMKENIEAFQQFFMDNK